MISESEAAAQLEQLYLETFGCCPSSTPLPGAGSDRRYFRLSSHSGPTVVGTWGADKIENFAFSGLTGAMRSNGLNAPAIFAEKPSAGVYLQQDLGDTQLLDLLSGPDRIPLSEKTLRGLVRIQSMPSSDWQKYTFTEPFGHRSIMWDLNYFKYDFLKPTGIVFDERKLEDEFERLASKLESTPRSLHGFMYRDFQSRNVMVKDGEPWWIDYQGGKPGPGIYDAISFLWQARAGFTTDERKHLLEVYASESTLHRGTGKQEILHSAPLFALSRTLQVLGTYGLRGLVEKKSHFIVSIPGALSNLRQLCNEGVTACFPELERVSLILCDSPLANKETEEGLVINIFSFSYKKGYPQDFSGNGGGFMFDCRGLHNPGRYDRYKPLTGLDREVAEFLEKQGETDSFLHDCQKVVYKTIQKYLSRGFSSLQIGFGCTGGRHRSVYCAQKFAEQLHSAFPALKIRINHRERDIRQTFNIGQKP